MFSQLVDQITSDAARSDLRNSVVVFVNEAIREAAASHDYDACLTELEVAVPTPVVTSSSTPVVTWTIPNPACFRRILYVSYDKGQTCSPTPVLPSDRVFKLHNYYYRAGDCFSFVGARQSIQIAYYSLPKYLHYIEPDDRIVEFDGCGFDPSVPQEEIDKATNWVLLRWRDVVYDGAMARLLRMAKDPRQPAFFSAFERGKKAMRANEGTDYVRAH